MKKLLVIISVLAICFSFAVPVSADTENVLVYEFGAEFFLNVYPNNGVISDEGYYTVTVRISGVTRFGDDYALNPDSTYFFTIDGNFYIYDVRAAKQIKPNVNFTGTDFLGYSCSVGRKIKNLKVYEVVESPFGYGGLAGNSSDIHYGVEVITDVFSKLWNVLTEYWWVMVGLCLPIAFYLLCILSDVLNKVPKSRFKPKLFSSGYYSGKKAYSSISPTFDINYNTLENRKRKNRKGFGSPNNVHDVFIVDGCTYYNYKQNKYPKKKNKSRTKHVNVDINVDD